MRLPSYLTALLKLIAQAFLRVEFGVVPWEFLGYLTLGQSLLQKTLMKVQMPVENHRNFLGQFSLGTNDSQSHGSDSRAHLHPSDVINRVPFGQLAQNCLCPFCGVSQTVKQKELLAYAVQAVGMPKMTLNSKEISSTRLKRTVAPLGKRCENSYSQN